MRLDHIGTHGENRMTLLKPAPLDLVEQMNEMVGEWVRAQDVFQTEKRTARLAIIEWRLQEMGYTMWPKDRSTDE